MADVARRSSAGSGKGHPSWALVAGGDAALAASPPPPASAKAPETWWDLGRGPASFAMDAMDAAACANRGRGPSDPEAAVALVPG